MKVTRLRAAVVVGSILLVGAVGVAVVAETGGEQRPADKSSEPAASNSVTPGTATTAEPGASAAAELEKMRAAELEKVQAEKSQFQEELKKLQEVSDRISQQLGDKTEGR